MSSLDVSKAMKFLQYFQGEEPKMLEKISVLKPIAPFTHDAALKVKQRIKRLLPLHSYQIIATKEYVSIRLFDDILFEPDSAVLTPEAKAALIEVAQMIRSMKEDVSINVQGHSNLKAPSKTMPHIKDAWDMSIKRATTVVEYLISSGVKPPMLSATGYGDSKPLYSWRHSMLTRRNSRVEIVMEVSADKVEQQK